MSLIPSASSRKSSLVVPENRSQSLVEIAEEIDQLVRFAADQGQPLHELEPVLWNQVVLRMGQRSVELFLQLQGDGDLGETITTEDGTLLQRSPEPVERPLRTVFGRQSFFSYVYSRGEHQKIELRPLDARMALPEGIDSYFFEEFSQYFCVEQAFGRSREGLKLVLQQEVCEDQLQSINHRLGDQAEHYLDQHLSIPPVSEEGELLVLTGDGKGVPLVRQDAQKVPITGETPTRPGNRRMATLAGVYSVDRFVRTPEEVLAALFRDPDRPKQPTRPRAKHKQIVARFAKDHDNGDGETVQVNGMFEAFSWASVRVEQRRQKGQELVRVLDGQVSLRETSDICLDEESVDVDVLDIIHVAGYVKRAACVFHRTDQDKETFSREVLGKILKGQAVHVVQSFKIKAGLKKLKGKSRQEIATVCRYFENNFDRMQYDAYLANGYPIATGVIEGACRHLVKDRMERTGMRWRLEHAQAMLSVRAVFQSGDWDRFHRVRIAQEQQTLHRHKALISQSKTLNA